MTDPFDVLRESSETRRGATIDIDPRFRAELLDTARRRLSGVPTAAPSLRPTSDDTDEPTEVTVQQPDRPRWVRPMLVAAACVLVAIGVVLAFTTLERSSRDQPADSVPGNVTTTVATTAPDVATSTDEQLIAAIKLDATELGISRPEPLGAYASIDTPVPGLFDLSRYSARPECSAFDTMLTPLESSTHGERMFGYVPSQPVDQIVVVLPDAATASAVFGAWTDPAFAPCLELYAYQWAFRFGTTSPPPFAVSADEFAFYTYEQPRGQVNAGGLVRVGRILTFVDASLVWYEPAVPLMSEQDFGRIIDRVVVRARAALAGSPVPGATTPTDPPPVSGTTSGPSVTT